MRLGVRPGVKSQEARSDRSGGSCREVTLWHLAAGEVTESKRGKE